jgi:serine/threonine-protein kinase
LNSRVPRDLETICLKCLHKEPRRRYASAAALAADLRCFLRGEAIAARPEGRLERWARRARKRPTLVVGLLGGLLLLAAVVGGGLWVLRERAANRRAREELGRIDQARRERELVARLDAIHLNRVADVHGPVEKRPRRERAAREYEAAFREAGLGEPNEEPEAVAARVRASNVRDELLAALDDWAVCATASNPGRHRWLLAVARRAGRADHARLRDPAAWADREALTRLTATALAEKAPVSLLVALGERLHDAGGDAAPFLKQVQQQYPGHFWVNFELARALLPKNVGESIRYFQSALAIRPRTAAVANNLGGALALNNRPKEALEHYRLALRIDPTFADAHNNLGHALKVTGRVDEAIDHYREALRLNPSMAAAHCNLGSALTARRRPDEAMEHFRKALRIEPRLPEAHAKLCALLKARGGPQAVVEHYRQVLRTDPEFALAHCNLGIALTQAGQGGQALDHFRHAIRIDPRLALAHYNLGVVLSRQGQFDRAADHLRQAAALGPKLADAHGALGQALLALGRFREARDATRRALDLLPQGHPLRPPMSEQFERCTQLLGLEARLPDVLAGKEKPADYLPFLEVCFLKKQYAAAARLAALAFAPNPKLAEDVRASHRYNAACAAALAGCGQGADAAPLGAEERARLREQARAWLEADLDAWAGKLEGSEADHGLVLKRLTHWRSDPDLAGVREPAALEKLPAAERKAWLALWHRIAAVLARAGKSP